METHAPDFADSPPLAVTAASDGRAGNAAQALGLAEALGRLRPVRIREVRAEALPGANALPAAAWHAVGRVAPALAAAALDRDGALRDHGPDIVIGAGRRVAPLVALAGRQGARTVQLLDPQMPLHAFDLVVAPEHDGLRGERVLTSLGALGRVTPARIAEAAEPWRERVSALPRPRVAVLLGGPGRMAAWSEEDAGRFRAALEGLAAAGYGLLVTASRRTDPDLLAALRDALPADRHLVHDGTGDNPYPGILGLADAVLVTADSVNMASEAASSGLPVHVFRLSGERDKARAFHDSLARRGIARRFEGRIEHWEYAPLAEADRIARAISSRLFPRR